MTTKYARTKKLNLKYLEACANGVKDAGYPVSKWIQFSMYFLNKGYDLELYCAKETVSKYITISHPKLKYESFKVRFSNHKPSRLRESRMDCDFFVGVTHFNVSTAKDAALATLTFFRRKMLAKEERKLKKRTRKLKGK